VGTGGSCLPTERAAKLERYSRIRKHEALRLLHIKVVQIVNYLAECKLGTHDVVIPTSKTPDGCEILFRFVLLSALDMEKEDTWQRMERLYHLDGGSNCAVVFLLQTECVGNAMASYMAFEMRYDSYPQSCETSPRLTRRKE
jgi:hypothetical protein